MSFNREFTERTWPITVAFIEKQDINEPVHSLEWFYDHYGYFGLDTLGAHEEILKDDQQVLEAFAGTGERGSLAFQVIMGSLGDQLF